mmetsp:Transcript_7481/g.11131  ORF Transcript_7481/g.11131 Transcript_7481/m.11131 type:complete len:273 (-) Transcript_7481:219-1037(-)|eukprot:CAMPEP_0116027632 /NCGR_PEP_ID=MMETSP0321-20121206/14788_1 /TAXON_ID=163516 /ORGANISM="Leptocylindrus danicus var. danicus, Strain B650" /LENGTH=272 /DNA_ID=CAMNT_0003501111 /DNA_START=94 /DNA_END=912 /DNA_ORIENTATION=-
MTAIKPLHAAPSDNQSACQKFAAAVTGSMEKLQDNGYSRERSVQLLLRVIQQNQSPPTDAEIFNLMSQKNLSRAEAVKVLVISRGLAELKKKQLSEEEAIEHLTTRMHAKVEEHLASPVAAVVAPATAAVSKKSSVTAAVADSKIRANAIESVASVRSNNSIKTEVVINSSNMDSGKNGTARMPAGNNKPVKSSSVKQGKTMKNLRKRHHKLTTTEDVSSPLEKRAAAVVVDPASSKKERSLSPSPAAGGRKRNQQQSQQHPHSSSKRARSV